MGAGGLSMWVCSTHRISRLRLDMRVHGEMVQVHWRSHLGTMMAWGF